MRSKLKKLESLSGEKASVYTILTEDGHTYFGRFAEEYKREYEEDLVNITTRLHIIGNSSGAKEIYFKLDEGLEWNDLVCAFYDIPDKHLRLYCIRINENIIILGNGGPKGVRTWQEDARLSGEVHEMMRYSEIIRAKLANGSLRISDDGLNFEGRLLLTEN